MLERRGRVLGGLGASVLFSLPLLRHVLACLGLSPATARHLARRLRTPRALTFLVPGGIAEMFLNDPDREVVTISRRKGFLKHALRAGAPVMPVYIFGQTRLFYTLSGRLQDSLRALSRHARVSLVPFVGRSWLSPFVPLQERLTCVVGPPLNMGARPIPTPTAEEVDALHAAFCVELRRLFERHKACDPHYADKHLYFDDEAFLDEDKVLQLRRRRRLEDYHLYPAKL